MVAAVTAVVLLIRRRQRQRRLQQGSEGKRGADKDAGAAASMEEGLQGKSGSGGVELSEASKLSKLGLSSQPSSPTASVSQTSLTASQVSPVGTAVTRSGQQPAPLGLGAPPLAAAAQQVRHGEASGDPPAHADGLQGVAALWAHALQTTGGGTGPQTPAGSATAVPAVLSQHMQQDELEMMQLASSPASVAATSDPSTKLLLSYIASLRQQQQQPGAAEAGDQAGGSEPRRLPSEDSSSQQGSQAALPAGGDGRAPRPADALPAKSSSNALIDLQPWRIEFSNLHIMRPLGEGSYGKAGRD